MTLEALVDPGLLPASLSPPPPDALWSNCTTTASYAEAIASGRRRCFASHEHEACGQRFTVWSLRSVQRDDGWDISRSPGNSGEAQLEQTHPPLCHHPRSRCGLPSLQERQKRPGLTERPFPSAWSCGRHAPSSSTPSGRHRSERRPAELSSYGRSASLPN